MQIKISYKIMNINNLAESQNEIIWISSEAIGLYK